MQPVLRYDLTTKSTRRTTNMAFSENLQFLRTRDNLTQEQLAERLEVSRQSVSKWEGGGSLR